MTEETPLDQAHRAMVAAPDETVPRLRYFGALAAAEMILLLEAEAEGDQIVPAAFETEDGQVVLAFDSEERLTAFTGAPSPYAALPGRVLADMLAGKGLGLGVNFGTDSAELLPAEAIDWWARVLATPPAPVDMRPEALTPPRDLNGPLLMALHAHLGAIAGLAESAWLADLRGDDGSTGVFLAFCGVMPGAENAIARTVSDAVRFSGLEDGAVDVACLAADDPVAVALARLGVRIDLPAPVQERVSVVPDPDAPPRLR
ncbi:hypothetical protein RGUI_2954 [Rhodovulum sp. P5]|uniref:SseB family protein n=1 Tax=Rhodovulum sp. P5 TaxID=1564506 RepID=UPI0009C1EE04|nr:SseB family protein [Rhodovulum sp. P5]ARE41095.1 hypothetical protein RGUI_2954 [Rhodovulum sp. P5]